MYFGRLAKLAVKTCAFRSRPIGLRREMTNLPLAGGRELPELRRDFAGTAVALLPSTPSSSGCA